MTKRAVEERHFDLILSENGISREDFVVLTVIDMSPMLPCDLVTHVLFHVRNDVMQTGWIASTITDSDVLRSLQILQKRGDVALSDASLVARIGVQITSDRPANLHSVPRQVGLLIPSRSGQLLLQSVRERVSLIASPVFCEERDDRLFVRACHRLRRPDDCPLLGHVPGMCYEECERQSHCEIRKISRSRESWWLVWDQAWELTCRKIVDGSE